jgi:hypothetical protein
MGALAAAKETLSIGGVFVTREHVRHNKSGIYCMRAVLIPFSDDFHPTSC